MRTTLWVTGAAIAGFALGAGVSTWKSRATSVPAPIAPLLGEIAPAGQPLPVRVALTPEALRRLKNENARIAEDTATFRSELLQMEAQYRDRLGALLTPPQREKLGRAPAAATPVTQALPSHPPATPQDVLTVAPFPVAGPSPLPTGSLAPEVITSILELTFVTWSLENLRVELGLTDEQSVQASELLRERRTRFLELADRLPPPTLRLLNLGRELRRAADAPQSERP